MRSFKTHRVLSTPSLTISSPTGTQQSTQGPRLHPAFHQLESYPTLQSRWLGLPRISLHLVSLQRLSRFRTPLKAPFWRHDMLRMYSRASSACSLLLTSSPMHSQDAACIACWRAGTAATSHRDDCIVHDKPLLLATCLCRCCRQTLRPHASTAASSSQGTATQACSPSTQQALKTIPSGASLWCLQTCTLATSAWHPSISLTLQSTPSHPR